MKNLFNDDTITAISTPVGKSGIGIVRLSGKRSLQVAEKIFIAANGKRLCELPSHSMQYGWIVENSKLKIQNSKLKKKENKEAQIIDEVLLTVMRAPRTYTREDIVEINCHSGIVVLKRILELVLRKGARLAVPGEFTKRAYINGRIDLAQAEAVLDVINSKSELALKAALAQLQGKLSKKIRALRKSLLEILAQLEASIDFSDQEIGLDPSQKLLKRIAGIHKDLDELLRNAQTGMILREGITCVICGRPNVGKSSLLNALLKKERAIVTAVPGTTRDILEETLDLFGIPLLLIDTAGIIKWSNLAEKEAVRRSKQSINEASMVLLVVDASQKLSSEDYKISRANAKKPAFVLLNKCDLPPRVDIMKAQRLMPGRQVLRISALRGTGLDRLKEELAKSIWQGKASSNGEVLITNLRHARALKKAKRLLLSSIKAIKEAQGAEIVALEVKQAQEALGGIVGEIGCEDVLSEIFSQFCIGK
ncbi:MAG: tRNA uridine-5-carboxymethylaminomethyl(34) synthesis GTPase MnmE [Candidatus Omnitrophica bacterium]|nr:tRNA uridine-5-carboxymethylaminomethyl(34) synthesis GTPase MnmE [Candidatus Omnitrophota bacterium]